MAIRGPEIIGIITLDDAEYKAKLKQNEALTRQFASKVNQNLNFNTNAAQKGLAALNATTILLAGSNTFLAIQLGRSAVATAKFAAAMRTAGGSAAIVDALTTKLGGAMVLFSKLTGIILKGPTLALAGAIGVIVGMTTALGAMVYKIASARMAWWDYVKNGVIPATEESKKLDERLREQRKRMDEARMARLREETQRDFEYRVKHQAPSDAEFQAQLEDDSRIRELERELAIRSGQSRASDFETNPVIRQLMIFIEGLDDAERKSREAAESFTAVWEMLDAEAERVIENARRREAKRLDLARDVAISTGLAKPSDFETDPRLKSLLQIQERFGESGKDESFGFGIGTRLASQFAGRRAGDSSVIGEQRETVKILTDIRDATKESARANKDVAAVLVGAGLN